MKLNKIIFLLLTLFIVFSIGCKKETVLTIPVVTWGGYAALFAANGGSDANKDSLFYKYGNFQVKLVQIEDPSLHLTGFSNGAYPIIWSTIDMIPILYDSLKKDPNTIPKAFGVFDYSAGGDGIIVRGDIKTGKDFKGKKISVAQYTPSHFFLMWFLDKNGLTSNDVDITFVEDAIIAKDTFVANSEIDICVTWSPFIYDLTTNSLDNKSYVQDATLFMTTQPNGGAYGIVADVYLARADYAKAHPDILLAFNQAMKEGYDKFMKDKLIVAKDVANLFGVTEDDAIAMFGDVNVNWTEINSNFFNKDYEFSGYNLIKLSEKLYIDNSKLPNDFSVDPDEILLSDFIK